MNEFEKKSLRQVHLNELSLKKLMKIPGSLLKLVRVLDKETKKDPELQAAVAGLSYHLDVVRQNLKDICKEHPDLPACKKKR